MKTMKTYETTYERAGAEWRAAYEELQVAVRREALAALRYREAGVRLQAERNARYAGQGYCPWCGLTCKCAPAPAEEAQ